MVGNGLAEVELFRLDPARDDAPRYQNVRTPYEGFTVLDVLRYIYENIDSTLAFRWACTAGCCRSCAVLVNGKPVLACMKSAERKMKIEPHPKFVILKDLVVDFNLPKMV